MLVPNHLASADLASSGKTNPEMLLKPAAATHLHLLNGVDQCAKGPLLHQLLPHHSGPDHCRNRQDRDREEVRRTEPHQEPHSGWPSAPWVPSIACFPLSQLEQTQRKNSDERHWGWGGRSGGRRESSHPSFESLLQCSKLLALEISRLHSPLEESPDWFHHNPKSTSHVRASCPPSVVHLTFPWSPRLILFLPGPLPEPHLGLFLCVCKFTVS